MYIKLEISIHALLAESDGPQGCYTLWEVLFLSTLSLRRATHYDNYNLHCTEISIHALLAESDRLCTILYSCPGNFYPRSPCGERRKSNKLAGQKLVFLSTLSLRRATAHGNTSLIQSKFLSTLSLRRATRLALRP